MSRRGRVQGPVCGSPLTVLRCTFRGLWTVRGPRRASRFLRRTELRRIGIESYAKRETPSLGKTVEEIKPFVTLRKFVETLRVVEDVVDESERSGRHLRKYLFSSSYGTRVYTVKCTPQTRVFVSDFKDSVYTN